MNDLFGQSRSVVKGGYALLAADSFVPGFLPGWDNSTCVVQISPALGARFCQFHITLGKDGQGSGNTGPAEFFCFVLAGAPSVILDSRRHRLETGSYVYIPPGRDMQFQGSNAQLLILQKTYVPLRGQRAPEAVVGHQRDVKSQPFAGHEDVRLQTLLVDSPAFDLAVNILTYQPGGMLPAPKAHVMENGLVMLTGQGIFRLAGDYHPVQTGDVIWTAPYCPQWFAAIGKVPASYLYYQDVNRDPM